MSAGACNEYERNLPAELLKAAATFSETVEYCNVIQACRVGTAQIQRNLADYGKEKEYVPMTKGTFLWVKGNPEGSQVRSNVQS